MFSLRMCIALAGLIETTWGAAIARNNVGIIGGYEVNLDDVPYIVALYISNDFSCAGSIIHESIILTAAHCVFYSRPSEVQVLTGTDRLNDGGYLVRVDRIETHPQYNNVTYENDIALLKLSRPIRNCYWRAGLINLPSDSRFILEGTMANITGWGRRDNTYKASNQLRQVAVPVVSSDCCSLVGYNLSDTKMCAGAQGQDSCQGDSGGPLTSNGIQIGIVSFGNICGIYPGVYTRTSSYLLWINQVIKKLLFV